MTVDYKTLFAGRALPLPSISNAYVGGLKKDLNGRKRPHIKLQTLKGFNFFEPGGYFYFPYGLYSAGVANLNLDKCDDQEPMIHKRDRKNTFLMVDSGGFQIATGVLASIWNEDGTFIDEKRLEILRWMEHTGDAMMTFDIPSRSIAPKFVKLFKDRNGDREPPYKTFDDCLAYTVDNLHFFDKHTTRKVPFVNVLHGEDTALVQKWYDAVKWFKADGWAFAGALAGNLALAMNQIIKMRDDGNLNEAKWLHFLGYGTSHSLAVFSHIQTHLRKFNPIIQVTSDSASAFVIVARFGKIYLETDPRLGKKPYQMNIEKFDALHYIDPKKHYENATSPIMQDLPWGDIVKEHKPVVVNKGPKLNTDTVTNVITMANNVERQLDENVKTLVEMDAASADGRKSGMAARLAKVCRAIDDIFNSSTPFIELDKHGELLRKYI